MHIYREILNNLSAGVCLIRARDGVMLLVNPQFENMFGYGPGELLGKHMSIVNAPCEKSPETVASALLSELERTGVWAGEVQNIRKNGSVFWCHSRISTFDHLFFGKVWVSVHEDISEKKQAESILSESELRYRALTESSRVLICTSGTDQLCDYVNPAWLDFTGRTLAEELGKDWTDRVNPEDVQRCLSVYVSAVDRHEKFSMNYRLRHHSGEYRWVQRDSCPLYDSRGMFIGYIGYCLDISALKDAEQKQRELSEIISRYAQEISDLYQHATCGYHSLDQDGVIQQINETELHWLGYTRDEIIGKMNMALLLTPQTLPIFQRNFSRFKETGILRDVELELVCKNGTILPVIVSATAVYNADGGYVMSRTTVSDMTERKKMEQERIRYLKRQEELSLHLVAGQESARRRLSAELHDRTSPNLAAIGINLEIIVAELPQEHSADLVDRLEDTRALITDTTASIREICTDLRPPLLDYAGLAAAMKSYVQQFSVRTGIAVKFDCANPDMRLAPDLESLLFRVFQEALTNCVKHAHATSVMVTLNHDNRPIVLTIADNGVGFDPQTLGKVPRIGLGVLNMREIAEVVGGKFTIESAHGKGTRITLEIS